MSILHLDLNSFKDKSSSTTTMRLKRHDDCVRNQSINAQCQYLSYNLFWTNKAALI